VSALSLALTATLALSGCTGGATAAPSTSATPPAPAPTVTVTVTETPAPVAQSPDEPLTSLTAWSLCQAAATNSENFDLADWTPGPYDAETVSEAADGSFEVTVYFAPTSGEGYGAGSHCTASGTLGSPTVWSSGLFGLG